jgi:hypothetical protein
VRRSLVAATLLLLAAGSAAAAPLVDGELALDGTLLAQAGYPPPAYPPPQQPYYYPPAPRPTVMTSKMTPNWGLFAAGLSLWVTAWALDMIVTYYFANDQPWESAVPVAGPLIQLTDGHRWLDFQEAGLVIDFIIQLGGLTMAVLGISIRHQVTVHANTPLPRFQLALTRGPAGHGGGLALTF